MKKISTNCLTCPHSKNGEFKYLTREQLEYIQQRKTSSFYEKNQYIFLENQQPSGVYCVYSGSVKIIKQIDTGKEFIVRHSRPGELVGYRSVLSRNRYNACGQAMEDSILCFIEAQDFEKLVEENPSFTRSLLQRLAYELGVAEERLRDISLHPARARLAQFFLRCLEQSPTKSTKKIPVPYNKKDIAAFLGMTQQTLIRILAEWKKNNILTLNNNTCEIHKIDALKREIQTVKARKRI
ncbi:MAG: Crp/Fnr family transcriptional regulator [bacterium JZ-2024 1]